MLFCKDSFLKAEVTPWYLQATWENQEDQYQPAREELAAIFLSQGSFSAVFSQSQIATLNIHMAPAPTHYSINNSWSSPPKPPRSPALVKGHQDSPVLTNLPASFWEQMELPTSFMLQVTWKISCRSPSRPSRVLHESSLQKSSKGRRLSNLISTLASFPGSLSLITDFKFPVSAEWEEGCQWVFLEYFGENMDSSGKDVLGHICVSPTSALPASLTALLSLCALSCLGTSLAAWPKSSPSVPAEPHTSWKGLQGGGKLCAPAASGEKSSPPCLRSKRQDDDYQTPFPTLIPVLDQLDPAIWELMLRS